MEALQAKERGRMERSMNYAVLKYQGGKENVQSHVFTFNNNGRKILLDGETELSHTISIEEL